MRRREFLGVLGGAAAAWPLAARAQEKVRRIGVLMHTTSEEPEAQARMAAFLQGLQGAGWEVGRNLRIETRLSGGDLARLRKNAAELVALNPEPGRARVSTKPAPTGSMACANTIGTLRLSCSSVTVVGPMPARIRRRHRLSPVRIRRRSNAWPCCAIPA